jgi:hypothetical protein
MNLSNFRKIPLTVLFLVIAQAIYANVLNGSWALDSTSSFTFTETNFSVVAQKSTSANGDVIEYIYDGPYELNGDTMIWFNKYFIKANLTAGTFDTSIKNAERIANIDSFYLGINLNGPNVHIGNHEWFSSQPMINDSSLKIYGFGTVEPVLKTYSNISGIKGDTLAMLQSAIENNLPGDGIAFSISIPDTQRHYRLYLWYCRPDSITNKPVDFRFSVYGSNIYDGTPNVDTVITEIGNWRRIGPYHSDAKSVIDIHAMTEAHNLTDVRRVSVSGIEINRGPSIKDVNTVRYFYRIKGDSLYLQTIEEKLFSSVALKKVSSGVKLKYPNRTIFNLSKSRIEKVYYNILGKRVTKLRNNGLYLSTEIGREVIHKNILLKSAREKKEK